VLSIAVEAKVTEATRGVQDGTLIAANATRHKLLGKEKISQDKCQACPRRPQCTPSAKAGRQLRRNEHEPLLEALTARMATPEAQALYRQRQETVELAFADFKEHRKLVRFSGHGLSAVRAEVGLSVLVHNMLSLLTALRDPNKSLAPRPPP
jgi:hypothetical protein